MGYYLLDYLGSGGFGTVYAARERNTSHLYAVKVLVKSPDPMDEDMALAYRGEGCILPGLNHFQPHIIRSFYSHGWGTPRVEIVMPLMEGSLANLNANHPHHLRPHLANEVLRQMLPALAYLSCLGYVHRDVKPQNIFYTTTTTTTTAARTLDQQKQPTQRRPTRHISLTSHTTDTTTTALSAGTTNANIPTRHFRLGDFGLCEHTALIPADGAVRGTWPYLAPELLPLPLLPPPTATPELLPPNQPPPPTADNTNNNTNNNTSTRTNTNQRTNQTSALYVTVLWTLDPDGV
ncbi:kinase-like domain-containing protein [Chaetomium sp. MPI-CAGE-AT-0009]|nr:kinase-like domain-containing protein [Chaetomium sp. MPI-CAGE-AT-0009]